LRASTFSCDIARAVSLDGVLLSSKAAISLVRAG
jgi:hypothetical protein